MMPQQQPHPNSIYATFQNNNYSNNNYLQRARTMNQYPSYYNQPNQNNNIPGYPPADGGAPQTAWNV